MNAPKAREGQGGRAAKKRGSFGNDCVPDAPGGRIVRGLANSDNAGDALPGGVALTFESAEVGGGDGEGAVI